MGISLSLGKPVSMKTIIKANRHFKPTLRLTPPRALRGLLHGPVQGFGTLKFFCLCLQQGPGTSRVFSFKRKWEKLYPLSFSQKKTSLSIGGTFDFDFDFDRVGPSTLSKSFPTQDL